MSTLPAVSVISPAFNVERTVGDTVRSLLSQDYPADRLQIIVVDNASTDNTATILAPCAHRITVIREPRRGRAQARNAGLRIARNPVVAFIDADCTAAPDWLSHLVPRLEDPSVGVAGGKILAARPCNAIEEFGEWLHDHARSIETFKPPYAITPNWASRREVLEQLGGFDEQLRRTEDADLSYRMLEAGYRIVYEERAVVYQRNKSTRRALFCEGFDDAFDSVPAIARHAAFLRRYGHRGFQFHRFRKVAANLARILTGRADQRLGLETLFEAGKCAGKICGSIRYGRLEL